MCLRVAYSTLTLALAVSSPVQAVESVVVCGSIMTSLVRNHAHVAHTCVRYSLVVVANRVDSAASPKNVAGIVLSYLVVSTPTAILIHLCWFTVTTVQFTLPAVVSRIWRDGLILGCMGTAQWIQVSRSSSIHARSNEFSRVKPVRHDQNS